MLLLAIAWIAATVAAGATVRVSQEDGAWDRVEWAPAGLPAPGDTVIISAGSSVTGMPALAFGVLIIRPGASLSIGAGGARVSGLINEGRLMIGGSAVLAVAGDITNSGEITGGGVLRMARDGGTIAGAGRFGALLVSAGPGGVVALGGPVVLPSLSIASGNRMIAGAYDLTVNGPYTASAPSGPPALIATTGTIALNGSVYGTARGAIVIGVDPAARPSKRSLPPLIGGVLGDTGKTIRIAASRRLGFSTLIGGIVIDSGVVVMADGIGTSGTNLLVGSLTNRGTLSAGEEQYRWTMQGELFNHGTIENCTLVMRGRGASLRSDTGRWDPGISIVFTGSSGDTLHILGPLRVARLTIAPASALDSNLVVDAGRNYLSVRHLFASDSASGCRLISDTLVSLWGAAHGIVQGDVMFEGFWGSAISGCYGGPGRRVMVAAHKLIAGGCTMRGTIGTRPSVMLTIDAPLMLDGDARLNGRMTITPQGSVVAGSDLFIGRSVRGGGNIHLAGAGPLLEAREALLDSIQVEIGREGAPSHVLLAAPLVVPRLFIHAGSTLEYHGDDSVTVVDMFRYDIAYAEGFTMMSAAARPAEPAAMTLSADAANPPLRYATAYTAASAVAAGEGYFIRLPVPGVIAHRGGFINLPLTIPVRAGWNLIGGGSIAARAANATATGTAFLSPFVTAIGGMVPAPLLRPGRSYWVKVSADGTITLHPDP